MSLRYKEPKWEHKKEMAYPHFGNIEKGVFRAIVDNIPYGCEAKITVKWSRSQHEKNMDKLHKKYKKDLG